MTIMHMVTFDDGDFYCEGNHLVGVFTTEDLAAEAAARAVEELKSRGHHSCEVDVSPLEIDKEYDGW
jgi:hypothetical protein